LKVALGKVKGEFKESLSLFEVSKIEGVIGFYIRDRRVRKPKIPLSGEGHGHISQPGG
jgi:hypothetical protein